MNKSFLVLLFTFSTLFSQDERVLIFNELKQAAETGDISALAEIGDYYNEGRFPLLERDSKKARQYWEIAASKGDIKSAEKASSLLLSESQAPDGKQDTLMIIESIKWYLVSKRDITSPLTNYPRVSKTTHSEAANRASVIIKSFKDKEASTSDTKPSDEMKIVRVENSNAPGQVRPMNSLENAEASYVLPTFNTLKEVKEFQMSLLSEFRKAQQPIYTKQDKASDVEIRNYLSVARKIQAAQSSLINNLPKVGAARNMSATAENKVASLQEYLLQLEIRTEKPVTRKDLNNAQIFMDKFRDILDTSMSGI